MARPSACKTTGCDRAPQVMGILKGWCCALCSIRQGGIHSNVCDRIEEVGRVELGEQDNIVLGYN